MLRISHNLSAWRPTRMLRTWSSTLGHPPITLWDLLESAFWCPARQLNVTKAGGGGIAESSPYSRFHRANSTSPPPFKGLRRRISYREPRRLPIESDLQQWQPKSAPVGIVRREPHRAAALGSQNGGPRLSESDYAGTQENVAIFETFV